MRVGATEAEIDSVEALVEASEAEVARFEAMIDKQTIDAPLDAVVLELFLSPGEVAIPGQPLLSLTNLNELRVTVYIPEFDLNWASIGDLVEVRFSAYPDKQYAGVVVHISDRAEFTPRNVQTPDERVILVFAVKIRIANPGGDLKPGLTVDVIFGGES
jgi:HlyD family secretion protein